MKIMLGLTECFEQRNGKYVGLTRFHHHKIVHERETWIQVKRKSFIIVSIIDVIVFKIMSLQDVSDHDS